MSSTMFRRAALRRVSSPEQLDAVVRTVLPWQWLALGTLLMVIAAALVWACVASVLTTLSAPGYLLPQSGVQAVSAPIAGTLSTLSAQDGQHVVPGQVLGTVTPSGGHSVEVMAPSAAGTVVEVDDTAGGYVSAGQLLMQTDPVGYPMVVYTYIPLSEAAGLPTGIPARVTFSGGLGSAYGYAEGTVVSVSNYPASPQRLSLVLPRGQVVNEVEAQGPSDEVVVQLNLSATTPSGIQWGSGTGPPGALPSGLSAAVQLVVGSHHPISDIF